MEWHRRLRFVELGVCSLSIFSNILPLGNEELRFRSVGLEWVLSSSSLSRMDIDSLMLNLRWTINLETPKYNRFWVSLERYDFGGKGLAKSLWPTTDFDAGGVLGVLSMS